MCENDEFLSFALLGVGLQQPGLCLFVRCGLYWYFNIPEPGTGPLDHIWNCILHRLDQLSACEDIDSYPLQTVTSPITLKI